MMMTPIDTMNPKSLRAAVDAVAHHHAQCVASGTAFEVNFAKLAHDNPSALARVLEEQSPHDLSGPTLQVLFGSDGHISGYRKRVYPLILSFSDRDLRGFAHQAASDQIDSCEGRSR